jgi:hypothetical protein
MLLLHFDCLFFFLLHILSSLACRSVILSFHLLSSHALLFSLFVSLLYSPFLLYSPLTVCCTFGCDSSSHFLFFHILLCTSSLLSIFSKIVSQNFLSNRPPMLTCGSSRATQACFLLLHVTMKFWEASLARSTSLSIIASIYAICSTPCVIKVVIFSLFHRMLSLPCPV